MEDIAGRYEILDKDNKFIFGKLYRARDLEEDTIVFIQLIKDNISLLSFQRKDERYALYL